MARHAGALTTSGGSRASFVCGWSSRQARGGPAIRAGSAEGRCYSSLDIRPSAMRAGSATGQATLQDPCYSSLEIRPSAMRARSAEDPCYSSLEIRPPTMRAGSAEGRGYSSMEIRPSAMRAGYRVRGVATLHWKSGLRLCEPDIGYEVLLLFTGNQAFGYASQIG